MNRKLNKALNYANTVGINKVIIVGEKELSEGKVSLKNMKTGEQELVDLEDLRSI
jgi:histidyl-tRNA synthetase